MHRKPEIHISDGYSLITVRMGNSLDSVEIGCGKTVQVAIEESILNLEQQLAHLEALYERSATDESKA